MNSIANDVARARIRDLRADAGRIPSPAPDRRAALAASR